MFSIAGGANTLIRQAVTMSFLVAWDETDNKNSPASQTLLEVYNGSNADFNRAQLAFYPGALFYQDFG